MYEALRIKDAGKALAICFILGLFLSWLLSNFTFWVGWATALFIFVLWNFSRVSTSFICIPHIILIVYYIQLVLAPWYQYFNEQYSPVASHMTRLPQEYFLFSVLSYIALFAGLFFFSFMMDPNMEEIQIEEKLQKRFVPLLDMLIILGFIFIPLGKYLGFMATLISNLRFVALFIYIILKLPNWKKRFWIVFLIQIVFAIKGAMFHELIIWTCFACLIYLYKKKISFIKVICVLFLFFSVIFVTEPVKSEYREKIWFGTGSDVGKSLAGNVSIYFGLILKRFRSPDLFFDKEGIGRIASRLNQGWITDMILDWVPRKEPFCRGETVIRAMYESPSPRILLTSKLKAGGKEYFERFTGHTLWGNTSMNLGILGEFYVNFGKIGAILAVFLYGVLIGYIVSYFIKKSVYNPLWIVFLPYVLFPVLKVESDFTYFINWFVKAVLIVFLLVKFIPDFSILFLKKLARRG